MIKECKDTGRSVEEAIENACQKLGYERDEVSFEILDLPKKGFLGFGANPARVRVFVEVEDPTPAPVKAVAPKAEPTQQAAPTSPTQVSQTPRSPEHRAPQSKPAAPSQKRGEPGVFSAQKAEQAADYLKSILAAMGLQDVEISVREEGETAVFTLTGDGLGMIIGRRGETMDALQYLLGLATNRMDGEYMRVTLDSGNYREKREKTLENLAFKLANTAVRTGRSSTLEPMNPYERRIIHSAVAKVEGAASSSIGEEPNRRVIISAANGAKAPRSEYSRDGARGGDNRNRNRSPRREGDSRPPRRDDRRPPRENAPFNSAPSASATPAAATPVAEPRTHAPNEGAGQPLYGKIELE